jgi:chromosome partitioning protein
MIIGIVNQKGGVGKTTIAVNLASVMVWNNHSTLLWDADPQGSVVQWQSIKEDPLFPVIHEPVPLTRTMVRKQTKKTDWLIIDSPPATGNISASVLSVSDLVLVPIGPSALDLWSSVETLDMINAARKRNRRMKPGLLISRKIPGTRLGREARDAVGRFNVDVLPVEINQRIAYVEAMVAGLSVLQYAPISKAAAEIFALYEHIIEFYS